MADETKRRPRTDLTELGRSGLVFSRPGWVQEEALHELRGEQGKRRWREFLDSEPLVGAIMAHFEMFIRRVSWRVDPADDSPEAQQIAEFVQECLDDMSTTWQDTLSEILTHLKWGWSYLETVYKTRQGPDQTDPSRRSRHNDGKIGWRKWATRSQESLLRWEMDDDGGIRGLWQIAAPDYQLRFIPIEKSLLFRVGSYKGSPEGRSIFRNAYSAWFYASNLQRLEAIGAERELAGLPVFKVPSELLSADASPDAKAMLAEFKTMGANLRVDDQGYVIMPSDVDDKGNPYYSLELVASSGRRRSDTGRIIERYHHRIAAVALADFILLGSKAVGSYALSDNKTEALYTALDAYCDGVAEIITRHAFPRLVRLNGWPTPLSPSLEHGDVKAADLGQLIDMVTKLSAAGFPVGADVWQVIAEEAKLPYVEPDPADATPPVDQPAEAKATPAQKAAATTPVTPSKKPGDTGKNNSRPKPQEAK